ncbi:Hydroxyproline-rich protein [Quillaja saponaria]|uniref:Hydroxyproline-rich protein n=1 Tax=Quillaja saponaria TaxID=32244 RepID=A0AAD7Q3X3_QUISA|nr:Hydroxyproline-rich protein [Quillaja saponaria]
MEKMLETPPKSPIQSEKTETECKTPSSNQDTDENNQNSCNDLRKPITPDRLRVPKAFKYPERYTSPTDLMMSPVTKGVLARNRKGGGRGALLPPGGIQSKIPDLPVQDVGLFQN